MGVRKAGESFNTAELREIREGIRGLKAEREDEDAAVSAILGRHVFYSWQSDLPNATNRGFIQKALTKAAAGISFDSSIEVDPVIDRDTQGVPGAPDIAAAIDTAAVFVADVSILDNSAKRPAPGMPGTARAVVSERLS